MQSLLIGVLRGQALTERSRLLLTHGLVGSGDAAAFEFVERDERGRMIVEFDEAGGFGETVPRFFFLRLEDIPVDHARNDEQQAGDPGGRHHHVASVEAGAGVLA